MIKRELREPVAKFDIIPKGEIQIKAVTFDN